MTRSRVLVAVLLCSLAAVVLYCTKQPVANVGGSGSEVVGVLVDQSGHEVSGAIVKLDTLISDSTGAADSTATLRGTDTSDAHGNFSVFIDSQFRGGTYNLICKANGKALVAFVSDIKNDIPKNYSEIYQIKLGQITMKAPGNIAGKVTLGSSSTAPVFCFIPGTSFMAIANDTGGYVISNVPEDTNYKVYFSAQGYLTGIDSPVNVASGQTTVLPDKVLSLDPAGDPPAPVGLSLVADTVSGVVKLSWTSVRVSDLYGYIVGRKDSVSAGYTALDTVKDTFFVDSVYRNVLDASEHNYFYAVKALDNGTNPSAFSLQDSIHTVPPSYVRPVIQLSRVSPTIVTASAGDTVKIAATFQSAITRTDTLFWFAKAPDSTFMKKSAVDALRGSDTLSWIWNNAGVKEVYVYALDDRGMTWRDSLAVHIQPAPVNVIAVKSTDSTVTVIWHKSTDPAFSQYQLYAADSIGGGTDIFSSIATIPSVADTVYTIATWKNGIKKYNVIVYAIFPSLPGGMGSGGIINTPPRFLTDTAAIQKSANVGAAYVQKLAVADVNKDTLRFNQLSQISGLSIADSTLSWTPAVADTGRKHIVIQVTDGFGGADTIAWNVTVTPVNVWSYIDSLSKARRLLSAVAVNGIIYAMGGEASLNTGIGATITSYSTVETYNAAGGNGTWTLATPLPSARFYAAIAPAKNAIYSFGGTNGREYFQSVDSFGISSGMWGSAGQMPAYRYDAAACAMGDTVYLIGGLVYSGQSFVVSSQIDAWDPATGTLTPKCSLNVARSDPQAVALNGKIYIIGGLGGSSNQSDCAPLKSVEVYDPSTNSIGTATPLTTARLSFAAATAKGKIYAIGGLFSTDQGDTALTSVEEFDPVLNTWTVRQNLPNSRYGCAAASWNDLIYVIGGVEGGTGGNKETKSVLIFYP